MTSASLETSHGVDSDYRHVAKHANPATSIGLGDAVLKWYDVARPDDPVPDDVRALARRALDDAARVDELRLGDGLGFVILHRCGSGGFHFLLVQTWNWWGLIAAKMTATSKNLYAFTFFMLTGLHAAHVIGGVILLGVVTARAAQGRYGSGRHNGVTYAAMYWHFLDAVWIVLFAVLVLFA